MSTDEFRSRMHHDVGTVLNGTDEIGSAKGIVDDEGDMVAMSDFCQAVDIYHVGVGVAEGLGIECLGLRLDGSLNGLEVAHINDGVLDALAGEGMGDEVERATIEVVGSHQVVARQQDILQRIGDGSGTRSNGETCDATFEGSHTVLKHSLRGVGEPSIDVARVAESKSVGSVLRVAEHIRCGLVDGHCTSIGCRVGLFLPHM